MRVDRRASLRGLASLVAGTRLAAQEQAPGEALRERLAPVDELVNAVEFEAMARLALAPDRFMTIAGGTRGSFDRMTFRQRLMVPALELDLTTELFGHEMFAPIIVGPVRRQGELHAEGERATARGAAAAKAVMIVSGDSSQPIERIAAETTQPLWYQVYADADPATTSDAVSAAVEAGCRAVCITVGVSAERSSVPIDWDAVDAVSQAVQVPVVVKGVMSPGDAETALQHGADGVVVSDHGGLVAGARALPIDVLPAVADAVGGRVPVLVDGSFRRGTDILKGLALGAKAVLVARPVMWGLAAYGAAGVQTVLELLQTELARNMAASGRPRVDLIDRALVRFDSR